ncbi:MAG TPA: amidohydrolase family protein [Gemmatimonadaceae bacterium]|nr:amidohydrolase family protein [Gemmatimonadaceae bacterium]
MTVIDGSSPSARQDRTVVVRGNRIVAEGPSSNVRVGAARVIEARGKYLIPGLWDMHVHTVVPAGRDMLALYLANGVTGVRDMAGDWATLKRWREEIARRALIGPRIVASGPYLEGGDVPIAHLLVRTPADAQPAVDSLVRLGVDFIKVHSQLSRESYFAIARAARARGIAFVGHVPRSVGATDASDSGQRSIEHLLTIPNQCTPADSVSLEPRFAVQAALGRCTSADLTPLFSKLVRNDTYVVPTLTAQLEVALWPKRELPGDSLAGFVPDSVKRYVAQIFPMPVEVPPNADVVGRAVFAKRIAIVGALHRAGVRLMTGTDAPLRNSPPGYGLHHELAYFVEAGLSPHEALKAATLEPARFLGLLDSLGVIAPGKVADLVLLDADPLANIRNAARSSMVLANGRLFEVRRGEAVPLREVLP